MFCPRAFLFLCFSAFTVLQIRKAKRDDLGIISHVTPLKCML